MDDWYELEDVLLNSNDPKEKENYRCWMQNYLTGCALCPSCPGPDPYD